MISIIEECRASPTVDTVAELILPLTQFDVIWMNIHHIQRLLFYKVPLITKKSFIETFIPNLKTSLSLALKHYLPLSGNMVCPIQIDSDSSVLPVLRFVSGVDSIPLIIAESLGEDLIRLAGNQPRKCEDFYPLIPVLNPPVETTDSKITPLLAVQVTLFPNSGISIGITNNHVAGDANVIVSFVKAWASINKFDGGDSQLLQVDGGRLIPFYDRLVIKDPYHLTTKFLNRSLRRDSTSEQVSLIPTNKVRATFVLRQSKIQELKDYVLRNKPSLTHVSSYTITCAYIWTCLSKVKDEFVGDTTDVTVSNNNNNNKEEAEFLVFSVDCRSRLDPPIPAAYFGNCVAPCITTLTHEELVGKDGFLVASEKIGAAIQEVVKDKEGIKNGSLFSKLLEIIIRNRNKRTNITGTTNKYYGNRMVGVTGTTKNDIYDADFGWGKPEKVETISIDTNGAISLNQAGREESGLEVGLSLPDNLIEAFATIFSAGLGVFVFSDKTQSSQVADGY